MASQRIASVVLKGTGNSNCCYKLPRNFKLPRHQVVQWKQNLLPASATAVVVFPSGNDIQARWSSTHPPAKGT